MKKIFLNLLLVIIMIFSTSMCCFAGTLDAPKAASETIKRVPPHSDYIAIREIHVWPRYINDSTGKEYWNRNGVSCSMEKYSSASSSTGLKVTQEQKATLDKKLTGYTQVGYHIEIKYEILGDEPFNQRKIVTQIPKNVPNITFLPNGYYTFEGNTTLQDPNFMWFGLFYRRNTYDTQFSASVTFAE